MNERESNLEALAKLQEKIEEVKELYASGYIKDEELSLLVEGFIGERSPIRYKDQLKTEESHIDEVDKEIIRLRNSPISNEEIRSRLNSNTYEYINRLNVLFSKGLIEKRPRNFGLMSRDLTPFYPEVKRLRIAGGTRIVIQEQLGLNSTELSKIIKDLIDSGEILKLKPGYRRPSAEKVKVQLVRKEGQTTREVFIEVINRHLTLNPKLLPTLDDLGKEIGVSRERVRQLKVEYESKNNIKLPFRNQHRSTLPPEVLDKKVKTLKKSLTAKEISDVLDIRTVDILAAMARVNQAAYKRQQNIIRRLNNQGKGSREIGAIMGLRPATVLANLRRMRLEGRAKRIRKIIRSTEEARVFEDYLIELMEVKGLNHRQVHELTGETTANITSYRNRLIAQGRMIRRGAMVNSEDFINARNNLDEDIIRLRKDPRELAIEDIARILKKSKSTIHARVHQLIKDGRVERRSIGRKKSIEKEKYDIQIVKLRNNSVPLKEIAKTIHKSLAYIGKRIRVLKDQGRI